MNRDDKDILSNLDTYSETDDTLSEEDDVLINELFTKTEPAPHAQENPAAAAPKAPARSGVPAPKKVGAPTTPKTSARSDARYTLSTAEIETLAAAAEDAVSDGRYGAALDSVFFTAGAAREALREKLNIRIPLGSTDTDLPVIAAAALIDSYLEFEGISGENIEEKLHLIIESSEDEHGARPSESQVELRVFKCALILCVQAEQSGRHAEIKNRLYGAKDSFLCKFLDANIDTILRYHKKDLMSFATSVKLQSRAVSEILDGYISRSKYAASFPKRFFAQTNGVLAAAITAGVLCLATVIWFIVSYVSAESFIGSFTSFAGSDTFVITLVIILELLFSVGMAGISWLVYTGGEYKDDIKKK